MADTEFTHEPLGKAETPKKYQNRAIVFSEHIGYKRLNQLFRRGECDTKTNILQPCIFEPSEH